MLTYFLFVLGFVFLIKGADLLVDGSSAIAKRLHVSNLVIGLTIVAFGTSAPELVVNIMAAINGTNDIAIGNILGSNISNVLLILGISTLIFPLTVQRNTVWKEILFALLAAVIIGIAANDILIDGDRVSELTRIDGLVFLSFFLIFMFYTFGAARSKFARDEKLVVHKHSVHTSVAIIILGLIGLTFGGQWIVNGAVKIAENFGMSQKLIGLTIIAVGTSLPELATSAIAARKKQCDIAIGNIVGSNIFNLFWVLGSVAVIKPITFNPEANIDILMNIFASFLLFAALLIGKKYILERWQGGTFIAIYIVYIIFSVIEGTRG